MVEERDRRRLRQLHTEPMAEATGAAAPKPPLWNSHVLQRRVMLALKKDIDTRLHGRVIRRVKYYCDVLLRE